MPGVDLVITDVDGTLVLPGKHNPTIAVRKAIADLQAAGITLSAATGRPYGMTKDLFLDVGLKGECIFDNGATIRNVETGKIVWKNWLEADRLREVVSIILPHAKIIDCFPEWREADAASITIEDVTEPAPYAFALVRNDVLEQLIKRVNKLGNLNVFHGASFELENFAGIQVTDGNADKFHAVNKLRELVHEKKKKTLVIGDASNDLPLFQAADIKVAMGNASDELKEAADFVVSSVEQDGFAEAMQKFVLN